MKPILVHFNKYTPSIHTIDIYYSILSSPKFESEPKSLKMKEEMNKSGDKIFDYPFKSVKTTTDSFYI